MDKCINCVVKMYYLSLIIVFLSMNMFMNIAYQYAYKLFYVGTIIKTFLHFVFQYQTSSGFCHKGIILKDKFLPRQAHVIDSNTIRYSYIF